MGILKAANKAKEEQRASTGSESQSEDRGILAVAPREGEF